MKQFQAESNGTTAKSSSRSIPNNSQHANSTTATSTRPSSSVSSEKESHDFASFNKHSSGIGMKLMMKMGYQKGKGLGVNESGIINPVDVKLRPKQMGLGHRGFDERTDAVKQAALEKDDDLMMEDIDSSKTSTIKSWKKLGKQQHIKVKPRTVQELIQEQQDLGIPLTTTVDKIIDMTGRESRVLTDMSTVSQQTTYDTITHLPELRYNIRLITDSTYSNMMEKTRLLRIQKNKQTSMSSHTLDDSQTVQYIKTYRELLTVLSDIQMICTKAKSTDMPLSHTLQLLSERFQIIQTSFHTLYWSLSLDDFTCSLLLPLLKIYYSTISRSTSDFSLPISFLERFLSLLKPELQSSTMSAYETLLYTTFFPIFRSYMTNVFIPSSPDVYISTLSAYYPIMPTWMYAQAFTTLLVPKLISSPTHVSEYMQLPRAPFLLVPVIEQLHLSISQSLSKTPVEDMLEKYTNLSEYFSHAQRKTVLERSVLPRLVMHVRQVVISPSSQDVSRIKTLLTWKDHFSSSVIGKILLEEVFVKWVLVLKQWMAVGKHVYGDICAWYKSWKSLVGDVGESGLHYGLMCMNAFLDDLPAPSPFQNPLKQTRSIVKGEESIRDSMKMYMEERGIVVKRLEKVHVKRRERFVIFECCGDKSRNKIECYFDDGVVFVNVVGEWKVMSVDDVIALLV